MQWTQVSAGNSISGGLLDTHSVLVGDIDTMYAFARGGVQSVHVSGSADSHSHTAQMSELGDAALTPKRCLSATAYDAHTQRIYAVGGSECTDDTQMYADAQLSHNMTAAARQRDGSWLASLSVQDWLCFGVGFGVAGVLALVWCLARRAAQRTKGAKAQMLLNGQAQTTEGDSAADKGLLTRRDLERAVVSHRPEVDI